MEIDEMGRLALVQALKFAAESAPALRQHWGATAQTMVAIGEMAELTAALADMSRGRTTEAHVREEIADVLFCAVQLASAFGMDAVASELEYKVQRTNARAALQARHKESP